MNEKADVGPEASGQAAVSKGQDSWSVDSWVTLALDSMGPAVGAGAVGVSVFALLASGPRLLGVDGHSGLAVVWTISTLVGQGLAVPVQYLVARSWAADGRPPGVPTLGRSHLVAAVAVFAAGLLVIHTVNPTLVPWVAGAVLAVSGWVAIVMPLGRLVGSGHYGAFARALVLEATVRAMLVGLAWWSTSLATTLLIASVGLPLWLSAAYARQAQRGRIPTREAGRTLAASSVAAVLSIALASQIVANSGALWLARSSTDPATAGVFVTLSTYMRIPSMLLASVGWVGLQRSAVHARSGDHVALRSLATRTLWLSAGPMLLGVMALLAVSDVGLRWYYGHGLEVPGGTLVLLGLAATLLAALQSVTQIIVGIGRAAAAAAAWALGAGVVTLGFALSTGVFEASIAMLCGAGVVAVAFASSLPRYLRTMEPKA